MAEDQKTDEKEPTTTGGEGGEGDKANTDNPPNQADTNPNKAEGDQPAEPMSGSGATSGDAAPSSGE